MEVTEERERVKVKILKAVLAKSELGYAKDALDYINILEKQLVIQRVSGSFEKEKTTNEHLETISERRKIAKMVYAINMLRDAECEDDVLNAIAIKEELNWMEVEDDLKDRWNDHFGDAKKHLP